MSQVRPCLRHRGASLGGIIGYPLEPLYEEVAFVAYHFHWPHSELMALEHLERRRWVAEISAINTRLNEVAERETS
jgi:hypothetical protein